MKTLLWLDDYRDPLDKKMDWLVFSPIGWDVDVHWVTSYQEFTDWIMMYGLPDAICFDHDLGEDLTGYDCAKYLVDYCMKNQLDIPKYGIQSSNMVGKKNIDMLLKNYIKFVNNENISRH